MWLNEPDIFKSWWRIDINENDTGIRITSCEQHKIPWQAHYQGFEKELKPFYSYTDTWYIENHKSCQAKNFVNLYKGKLYKCPTTAVLEHTLTTFNLTTHNDWQQYLQNYQYLDTTATDIEIADWLKNQQNPEKICNMCGFSGPKYTNGHLNKHELKKNWKLKVIT